MNDLIAERRADPRDDLLSDLIAVEEEGDRLSTDEMAMLAQAVLMAGTDTTRNQLACSVALFAEHPEQWALLAEHPELAARAVEESMRYLGAVRGTARVASEDIVYRGVLFPRGTFVATSLAGANHDPEAFDEPDVFDITNERGTAQMTFGAGIHHCMGAALARAELQEALPLLAGRLRDLASDGDVEWKPSSFGIWGPARPPAALRADRLSRRGTLSRAREERRPRHDSLWAVHADLRADRHRQLGLPASEFGLTSVEEDPRPVEVAPGTERPGAGTLAERDPAAKCRSARSWSPSAAAVKPSPRSVASESAWPVQLNKPANGTSRS